MTTFALGFTPHVQRQARLDLFVRAHPVDVLLPLAIASVAPLHRMRGGGQQLVIEKREGFVQRGGKEFLQCLPHLGEPLEPPPKGVPEKALKVLKYVDKEGSAPPGYEGGRTFLNVEKLLPQTDAQGRRIKYREWDVNPLKPGVNRGPERLVTGSDGSAYYTGDHYKTFKKIR